MRDSAGRESPFKLHGKNEDGTITLENLSNKSLWKSDGISFVTYVGSSFSLGGAASKYYELSEINEEGYLYDGSGYTFYNPVYILFEFVGYNYTPTKLKFTSNPNYKVTFNNVSLDQFNQNLKGLGQNTVVQVKIHKKLIGNLITKLSSGNVLHLQYNGSQEEFNLFKVNINSNDDFTEQTLSVNSNFNYNIYSNSLQRVRLNKEFNMR